MLRTREQLEAAIEEAILALDVLDGDADLEETGDDEPSLCGTGMGNAFAGADRTDLEEQCEDEGAADADLEPWLGSNTHPDQTFWARSGSQDLEKDDGDDEPSLSAGNQIDQSHWASGTDGDLEGDNCDSEPSLCGLTAEVPYGRITLPNGEIAFGDRDLEVSCEDEGAITGDDEPDAPDVVLPYANDGHDQTRIVAGTFDGQPIYYGVA